ncbi:macro domain-containing protein [Vreelandella vilamensis]|uniref:macro domain-containing protein n=1 Tax=Vreelandella vilamensis TaxID=531309 RepID=UPI00286BBD87|nr:macro domain-containing protein [Halomonas vilamensis]
MGPVYGVDKPEDQRLADCYRNALKLADEHGIERLAFPALSTGAFGYPAEQAAQVCATTLEAILPTLHKVRLIRFVLFDEAARQTLHDALAQRLTIDPAG